MKGNLEEIEKSQAWNQLTPRTLRQFQKEGLSIRSDAAKAWMMRMEGAH